MAPEKRFGRKIRKEQLKFRRVITFMWGTIQSLFEPMAKLISTGMNFGSGLERTEKTKPALFGIADRFIFVPVYFLNFLKPQIISSFVKKKKCACVSG